MNAVQAQRRFASASTRVARALTTKGGGVGAEKDYASAYSGLVTAGLAPKLRGKYRA